jgi:hypothetical protein
MITYSLLHHTFDTYIAAPPNPGPKEIPGVATPINTLMGYLKWGVLVVIIAAGFVGAGALAGGRIFGNHGASKIGVTILMSAIAGAVVYVGIYALITSVTG